MSEKTIQVGDVVAWADVPDGAMVRELAPSKRVWVRHSRTRGTRRADPWGRWREEIALSWILLAPINLARTGSEPVTIVALGLTGQESADDLRRLAEVFEVREALLALWDGKQPTWTGFILPSNVEVIAESLHAAGWRPGMTAEDAARLLAEAR